MECTERNLITRAFGLSITRNLYTRVLTISHVKRRQSTTMEQKRFDLRSLSPATRYPLVITSLLGYRELSQAKNFLIRNLLHLNTKTKLWGYCKYRWTYTPSEVYSNWSIFSCFIKCSFPCACSLWSGVLCWYSLFGVWESNCHDLSGSANCVRISCLKRV